MKDEDAEKMKASFSFWSGPPGLIIFFGTVACFGLLWAVWELIKWSFGG
jgi:hypothetical protein